MVTKERYVDTFVELIRRASAELPPDVVQALEEGREREERDNYSGRQRENMRKGRKTVREDRNKI